MAPVNDNTLVNMHSLVTPHIYSRMQHVICSSDTYRHNGGFLKHKTGAQMAFLGIAKMISDILQSRTFVIKSRITKILQPIRYLMALKRTDLGFLCK